MNHLILGTTMSNFESDTDERNTRLVFLEHEPEPADTYGHFHRAYRPADSGCDGRQVRTGPTAATFPSLSN